MLLCSGGVMNPWNMQRFYPTRFVEREKFWCRTCYLLGLDKGKDAACLHKCPFAAAHMFPKLSPRELVSARQNIRSQRLTSCCKHNRRWGRCATHHAINVRFCLCASEHKVVLISAYLTSMTWCVCSRQHKSPTRTHTSNINCFYVVCEAGWVGAGSDKWESGHLITSEFLALV